MKDKQFVTINNDDSYTFRLEMDDIRGTIRLTKNTSKKSTTKITNRNVPINTNIKWEFHKTRTGYSEGKTSEYNFIGSYVDRVKEPLNYDYWKQFIINRYKQLKQTAIDK